MARSLLSSKCRGKRLEILFQIRADARRLGVLAQPGEPASAAQLPHIRSAAAALGKELLVVEANSAQEFSSAFGRLKEWQADALVIVETGLYLHHRKVLIDEATRNRWPTVNSTRQYLEVGGLISYGVDYLDGCKRSAEYVDRILKGGQTRRPAHSAADQIRTIDQPEGGQDAGAHRAAHAARARRRGDRIRLTSTRLLLHALTKCGHVRFSAAVGG